MAAEGSIGKYLLGGGRFLAGNGTVQECRATAGFNQPPNRLAATVLLMGEVTRVPAPFETAAFPNPQRPLF